MNITKGTITKNAIEVAENDSEFGAQLELVSEDDGIFIYKFSIYSETPKEPSPIKLKWKLAANNVKGIWKPGALHDKRLQYDWELEHLQSRISVDAPIVNVFGYNDFNLITFACSDAINLMEMNALLREEDNCLYCHISFFTERHEAITHYEAFIRVDYRPVLFSESLNEVSKWWEQFDDLKPCITPDLAKTPLYSTWYNFHQDLDENILLEECKIAKDIGYELIILDDGWQTMDTNRGYDYTGDWNPDRFPDMAGFVKKIHDIGMEFGLWYSVPFCGKNSKAYKKFEGKFLTENHRWAPVFDPRYPEVRQYLIDKYTNALRDWNLDVFKLDFIDDFKVYPETKLTKENGRDYANVNAAVDRLLSDAIESLKIIKPDIAIEFRQQYIGPALRKFGNMFRAFDCPNDPVTNRIRITDIKLLCGASAVHSDMIKWHETEKTEIAALQVLNAFFGVPQMSIHLRHASENHLNMIRFYTKYWKAHSHIIMDGEFTPVDPLANYPVLKSEKNGHAIYGIYEDFVADMDVVDKVDFLNAKYSINIAVRNIGSAGNYLIKTWNCEGKVLTSGRVFIPEGLLDIKVPSAGMVRIKKLSS